MKLIKRMILIASLVVALVAFTSMEAFALTTDEVQAQVNAQGKEAVTGNILVWFLCAVAFLKVSQKIDSFMSSLGIHVGNTGGSMLAEMMIAARGFQMMSHGGGHRGGGGGSAGGSGSGSGGSRFLQNGVGGAIGRSIQRGATKNANGTKSGGVGGAIYHSSVAKGGGFANRVIGNIAHGSIGSTGTISGSEASDALMSYMGYTALGPDAADVPSFSDVEIGGGRIMATETSSDHPDGIAMGMYSADQYMAPSGDYSTVTAADGSSWYKQYASDTVQRTPYLGADGSVAYNESIVKKLPNPPARKDRI